MNTRATAYLTVPNLVSGSRVALAMGFVAVDAVPVRVVLLLVASFSDFLDGWLARRARITSRFGALLDPVADRLFVMAVVFAFLAEGQLSVWHAVALLFRDVMSLIGWFVARNVSWLRSIPFRARRAGKLVTVLQFAALLCVLLYPSAVNPLVWTAFVIGVVATVDYTLMLWRERDREPTEHNA
jgi:CDP-diacylglycerol--glycerol-3-phosphate 3-phosphatidyltransferase